MFFSMQLVTLPKQMLPESYQKYVVSLESIHTLCNKCKRTIILESHIELNSTMWMFIGFMIFGAVSS